VTELQYHATDVLNKALYKRIFRNSFQSMEFVIGSGVHFPIHVLEYRIRFACFSFLARSSTRIFPCYLLQCQCLILYVCSAQNNTKRLASEEERLARLRRTLHSLATRVPKIILTRVDSTFSLLKNKAVSGMHSIINLYQKHFYC
jgi:hypothetical protein